MEKKYCVYKHTTPSGKVYIGITGRDPYVRWRNGTGYSGSKYFNSAIQKYGWANIKHEILMDGLTKEEACQAEKELIRKYDSTNTEKGYNRTFGGNEGMVQLPEIRKIISEKSKQHHSSPEYRMAASEWMHKRVVSEETRKKISEFMKKRPPTILPEDARKTIGRKNSEKYSTEKWKLEHKQQLENLAMYGIKKSKKVDQFDMNGNYIKTFSSMKEAGRETSIRDGNICKCCKGKTPSAGGYIWRYAS